MDIEVTLLNNSFLRVRAENGIKRELSDYFSFYASNHKWDKRFKAGYWDGKIRLFNKLDSVLPAGLFFRLKKFCRDYEYSLKSIPSEFGQIDDESPFDPSNIAGVRLPFVPDDYQARAAMIIAKKHRRTIISPTGSGKSLIMYLAMRYYLELKQKRILIIVPRLSLVEQMYTDFWEYGKPEGIDVRERMERINETKDKETTAPIVIANWQAIYRLDKEWFDDFGMVLGDECHEFKAKSLTEIMNKCENANYRVGLSGSLDDKLVHRLQLEGLFGPLHRTITTKELQDRGRAADLNIDMLEFKYPVSVRRELAEAKSKLKKKDKKLAYSMETDVILSYESRNRFIANLAHDLEGNTLILFNFVEKHGKILRDMISSVTNKNVYFVHGSVDVEERERIRSLLDTEENCIVLASYGVFSTGINSKEIHNIIFAQSYRSLVRVVQSIGRGLRVSETGRATRLFDLSDNLKFKGSVSHSLKHAKERKKIYDDQEFKYKSYQIPLK